MNFVDAIATGLPLQRPDRTFVTHATSNTGLHSGASYINGWMDPHWMLTTICLRAEDVLATDWEVKPKEPQVLCLTARQIEQSYFRGGSLPGMLKDLGFSPGGYGL